MNKFYMFLIYIFLTLFATAAVTCNAPRTNPLDPLNPDKPFTSIEGLVKTISFPNAPISNVKIYWQNDNLLSSTNAEGQFTINNIRPINGWLVFRNEKFVTDSVFIQWDSQKGKTVSVFLNAKPVLDSLEFYSIVLNRFQYSQTADLFIRARISDIDGVNDIDSVYVQNTFLNFFKILTYNVNTHFYETKITLSELTLFSIDEIIGKNFEIIVRDLDARFFTVGSSNIKRIIKQEIEISSPSNHQSVSSPFVLSWKRFTPGFSFKYLLQISTDTTPPEVVWQVENVSPDSISYLVNQALNPGEYFWTIWAIDEFKNRARSKPATFNLE
ncbi:MAG: hypothetical protein AUK34_05060 [Ignavibacteria bacterium CG2_30_36_16]|nr:hypothetical protein [Ignavibacteria bacterium]OIP61356.1 MAG: hypothetical protein AUK34_05060 [Ignavibacteria bacterium CG2_30_36_16]PJA99362.1 MAG: hypothetical protein CO127_10760 [Ignavibacteria bacterium CG_4_9_14_3_um_filter_36_18]